MTDYNSNKDVLRKGLQRYFNDSQLKKIENTSVFIAGCGGLGSNIAHILTRCGFKKLTILDYDIIENSNLNRQLFFPDQLGLHKTEALADTLKRLEPDIELTLLTQKLSDPDTVAELTFESDILVEAFDKPESKAVFVTGALKTGKPVVSASGLAGYGHSDEIHITKPYKNLYMVGDSVTGINLAPPLSPRVNVAAAKQADIVLTLTLDGDIDLN